MNLPKKIETLAAWHKVITDGSVYEDPDATNMTAIAVEVSIIEERINQLIDYLEEVDNPTKT